MAFLDGKFYYPRRKIHQVPEDFGIACESVHFPCQHDCMLHGLWFAAHGRARGTVVHCHGNFGNVTYHFGHTYWLSREGFNVLCFDYRGYGKSGGRISRAGTLVDAHAAIDYVRTRPDVDPARVLLFGQSLGGAVAVVAAAQRRDLAGVAVDGAFSNYRDEGRWVCSRMWYTWAIAGPLAWLGFSRGLDPIDYVEHVAPTPLYLFHGVDDDICPSWMSQALYDRAREPKTLWLVPGMDHDQALHELADEARPRLVGFYQECLDAGSSEELRGQPAVERLT